MLGSFLTDMLTPDVAIVTRSEGVLVVRARMRLDLVGIFGVRLLILTAKMRQQPRPLLA